LNGLAGAVEVGFASVRPSNKIVASRDVAGGRVTVVASAQDAAHRPAAAKTLPARVLD
jgi:hypothetical protein